MDIIAALIQGDQVVFEEVYRQYHERVYFYVLKKTRSAYLAEETTQLCFIKLWQYRASLDTRQELFSQIFRITRTTMIDLLRIQYRREHLLFGRPGEQPQNTTLEQVESRETHLTLLAAVQEMPPVRRQVFILSRFQGLTYQQIADQLSISAKTVEGHITQALKDLRKQLPLLIVLGLLTVR